LIIGLTLFIEILGAVLLYIPFSKTYSSFDAVFYAIFHSISAFCNAGISLLDGNVAPFANSIFPTSVLSLLVI